MTDLTSATSTTIMAPIQEVWQALTTPDLIGRVVLRRPDRDRLEAWEPDRPPRRMAWSAVRGQRDDRNVEPPELLVHTHWSDLSGTPGQPGALSGGHLGIETA